VIRSLELSVPSPNLGGRVRGLRLSLIIHLANDLIKVNGYINCGPSRQRTVIQHLVSEESACNVGDLCSIPKLGRSPGGGHGNRLQYSCLENSMDRGAWRAAIHGVAKSQP